MAESLFDFFLGTLVALAWAWISYIEIRLKNKGI